MQPDTPMPYANTGLVAPNNFTNSAGVFDYTSGTVTTTLDGPYVAISDFCGALSESASGGINLGGVNGEHDCTVPAGTSAGNTAASRSGMYEVNKIHETARGYLPSNPWLNGIPGPVPTVMNWNLECNAFYSTIEGSINFYRNLGNCRNTGEIAAVFDHEWGHGMDDNDTIGTLSSSSEGYADIASMYRLWASCVGYGFFLANQAPGIGCGVTSDGTGANQDEAQTGAAVCDLDCSGVRDADYLKITPGTPLGASFVCASCLSGSGPCGRQVHCSATPTREAAWNFVARELQNAPGTDVDANTAFIIGDKIFYQGSGNITSWHNCSCPSTSDGCNAGGGYLQWLAADDDNGNLNDGTPHMTDLFAAFNTNGIACAVPAPVDSGCAGGPATPPVITASPGHNSATLNWGAVAGATQYNVYRTEGYAGCNFGKVLVGTTAGLSFTDTQVGNGRGYSYVVMAEGANDACFTAASNCATVTPQPCAGSVQLDQPSYSCSDTVSVEVIDVDLFGTGTLQVEVTSNTEVTPELANLTENPPSSGTFTGSIATTSAAPSADGAISITDGDTITVAYDDASFCGPPQTVTATAAADCAAVLSFTASAITDACAGGGPGDNDGIIDPGETITIEVTAENTSVSDATGISGTLSSSTSGVTILDGTATFPDIPAGGSASSDAPHFTIAVDQGVACASSLDFTIDFTTNQGNSSSNFSLATGTPPFQEFVNEGFGGGIPGTWTVVDGGTGNGGPASTWTAGNPGGRTIGLPFSGTFVIVDSDVAGTTPTQDEQLITPSFDASLCTNVQLEFSNQFQWYAFGGDEQADVDVSTDGGATWTNVLNMQDGNDGYPTPNTKTVDLSATAAGQSDVRVRFHYWQGDFDWWWAVDNVVIDCTAIPQCNNCASSCPTITVDPATLPDGTVGAPYNQNVTASGGTGPYTFAVTSGALPAGLTLDTNTGQISGTPTTQETANFTITATDDNGCIGSRAYTVQITCSAISLAPGTLPDGTIGAAYNQAVVASGGTAPYGYAVTAGALPAGLTLDNLTGAITGTPTTVESANFTITATDSNGCTGSQAYTVDIACPTITLSPLTLPDGGIGSPYSQTVTPAGGTAPYTFAVTSGNLPAGLTLDANTGEISGTPTTAETANFTITATDDNGCTGSQAYSIVIQPCPTITVSPATLPDGSVGSAYNQNVTASGGTAPYTFAVTSGALPAGLTLDSNTGAITGTPTTGETANFTITATDDNGCTGSQAYTVTITSCLFCDDFENSVLDTNWTYIKNISFWSETGGALIGTSSRKTSAIASPVFLGCTTCYAETTMQTAGGFANRVWLLLHYIDKSNTIEVLMKEETDRWIIKQRVGKKVVAKAKVIQTINANVAYTVRALYTGTEYQVFVDGVQVLTLTPVGAISGGTVGFRAKRTTGTFGYIEVN
jgi:hypothetical protein